MKGAWTAGGPDQVRKLERGCPFSQRLHNMSVCPFPKKEPYSNLAEATHPTPPTPRPHRPAPRTIRKPLSHQQTQPPPPSQALYAERGSRAAGEERRERGQSGAAGPGASLGQGRGRLPSAGALGSAGRTRDGSSSRSSGNRSQRLCPAEGERLRGKPGIQGSTRRQRAFMGALGSDSRLMVRGRLMGAEYGRPAP